MIQRGKETARMRLIENNPVIAHQKRGLPDPGKRPDSRPFSAEMFRIDMAYRKGNDVYSMDWPAPDGMNPYNPGGGSPFYQQPFPPAAENVLALMEGTALSQYGYASGDEKCRQRLADYFTHEGLLNENGHPIDKNNVIFFNSTTEAFSMLMQVLCRPGDVVLFTAPTYGLLAYAPERIGAFADFLPLKEEDGWLINPEALDKKIRDTNAALALCDRYAYTPCVCAFVNLNPHNPTGKVMGRSEDKRIAGIDRVCQQNAVFVIDDIIYRDLCYDSAEQALPIATIPGAFQNTITLLGTSKSYGLAGARAGAVAAVEEVIRALRNAIFQRMDSMSLQVAYLMAGAFNTSPEREAAYRAFFPPVIQQYKQNLAIVRLLVNGMQDGAAGITPEVLNLIENEFGKDTPHILRRGIPGIRFVRGMQPESGFFCVLDLTQLKGRTDPTSKQPLESELDILYYFYRNGNIKLLTGSSFAWPVPEEIVTRFSYAFPRIDLVRILRQINDCIRKLD